MVRDEPMAYKALTLAQRRPPRREPDRRPSAAARGYDATWRKVRDSFLARHPLCVFCNKLASVVDHVKPIAQGGARLDDKNLRGLCRDCHAAVTGCLRATGVNELPTPK